MSRDYRIHKVKGQHLTFEDRKVIAKEYNQNLVGPKKDRLSRRALAGVLGLAYTTFRRELQRGLIKQPVIRKEREVLEYSEYIAQDNVNDGNWNKGCGMKMTSKMAGMLKKKIVFEHKSPAHACRDLKREGVNVLPCLSSIYNHIHHGDIGIECSQTPYGLGRKPCAVKHRPRLGTPAPERLSIDLRPGEVADRIVFGHWEMDCVVSCMGGRGGLLVLTERKTRYTIVVKLKAISQKAILKALLYIVKNGLMKKVLSITTDNGSEFLDSESIRKIIAKANQMVKIYYAHAYCAWEKGCVENVNRHIRRLFPKGTDFMKVTSKMIKDMQNFINSIPRQILKGLDANEEYLLAM